MRQEIEEKKTEEKKKLWYCYTERKIRETEEEMTDCLYQHHTISVAERD